MAITLSSTSTDRRTRLAVAAAAGALALSAGLGACGSGGSDAHNADTGPALLASAGATTAATPDAASELAHLTETTDAGQEQDATGAVSPSLRIDSFRTPDDIDCHNGGFQEFTASWTTWDAASVTISIDGPGAYADYPADGETSLPFNCSSPHTFVLTAHGADGTSASQQVTLQPRNVPDDDDELVHTTAKTTGGSTGDGPATDSECEGYAAQMNALDTLAVSSDQDASNAAINATNAIEDAGMDRGCFFVYT